MAATLPDAQRARFVKVLALLASDHAGERAAAAWQATQLLRTTGLTWEQVVTPALAAPPKPERVYPTQPASPLFPWAAKINALLCRTEFLTEWEIGFVQDIAKLRRLSPRQVEILLRIFSRVVLWESGP